MADTNYEINAGFFDAIDSDRVYSADDMNKPYRRLISEGIFATPEGEESTDFQIFTADDGMNVIVSAGDGLLGEKWVENSSDFLLTILSNSETLTRIDSIILQVDTTQSGRAGNIVYRTGTASSSPVHPDINTEDGIYELRLADITVSPSCTAITQDLITDCRGSDECPWITSLIYQVDTSTLYAQWQAAYQQFYNDTETEVDEYLAELKTDLSTLLNMKEEEFDEWFESIKDTLSEDTAGNLLMLIEELQSTHETDIDKLTEIVENKLDSDSSDYIKDIVSTDDMITVTRGDDSASNISVAKNGVIPVDPEDTTDINIWIET